MERKRLLEGRENGKEKEKGEEKKINYARVQTTCPA